MAAIRKEGKVNLDLLRAGLPRKPPARLLQLYMDQASFPDSDDEGHEANGPPQDLQNIYDTWHKSFSCCCCVWSQSSCRRRLTAGCRMLEVEALSREGPSPNAWPLLASTGIRYFHFVPTRFVDLEGSRYKGWVLKQLHEGRGPDNCRPFWTILDPCVFGDAAHKATRVAGLIAIMLDQFLVTKSRTVVAFGHASLASGPAGRDAQTCLHCWPELNGYQVLCKLRRSCLQTANLIVIRKLRMHHPQQ